jgi:2'-5' RNA ligase
VRLFIAVWPPPEVVEAIAGLARPELEGVSWTRPEQWHITLRFLGWVPDDALPVVVDAVEAIELPQEEAPVVTLGPATACFGRRVLQVPARGLEALAAATVQATAGVGEPPEPRPFAGHLTLARSRIADRRRGRGGPHVGMLAGVPLAASWTATELTLVRSHLHRAGARYEVVHRRPMPAR